MHLLIIDPQEDFCNPHTGSLYVPGADADMVRLAGFIRKNPPDEITISLDTHQQMQIFHPCWWVDKTGLNPNPFTLIRAQDVKAKVWTTSRPEDQEWSEYYVNTLEQLGKFVLCIWPYHCIIGSTNHAVFSPLYSAITDWERTKRRNVKYLIKGSNPYTEHYSALGPEIDYSSEETVRNPFTATSEDYVLDFLNADSLVIAGEALSHCLKLTVQDILKHKQFIQNTNITLLLDATSGIPGFESECAEFVNKIKTLGVVLKNTTDFN